MAYIYNECITKDRLLSIFSIFILLQKYDNERQSNSTNSILKISKYLIFLCPIVLSTERLNFLFVSLTIQVLSTLKTQYANY